MKLTLSLLFSLFLTANISFANTNEDCATTLSLFVEAAKAKNYDAALPYLKELRQNCAAFHIATYQYGERIYKDRIENSPNGQKLAEFNEYKALYQERLQHFPGKTEQGAMLADFAQVMFDNGIGTEMQQFEAFENAYKQDKENFTSPKAIYTYFSLAVDLQEEGKMPVQKVFDLYDELINKIEIEENALAQRITPLIEKQEDAAESLTSREQTLLKNGETNLRAYAQVKGSINGKLGILADCPNLIPLYQKDFEEKKTDVEWLQRAASRLSAKDCEDPLFFKLVEALHNLNPSSKSALYLGQLAEAEGKANAALQYFTQSAELETNSNDRANVYYRIAENFRKKGNFSQARNFYRKAIDSKPSFGRAYLQIANMYANSSDACGNTTFEKRAINWLAEDLARTAARVDPSVAANANAAAGSYAARAPSKQDIFQESMQGKTVSFQCWVGQSVRVPVL